MHIVLQNPNLESTGLRLELTYFRRTGVFYGQLAQIFFIALQKIRTLQKIHTLMQKIVEQM
jgi:hypothetical protein